MNSWKVSSSIDRLELPCGSHESPQLPSALLLLPGALYKLFFGAQNKRDYLLLSKLGCESRGKAVCVQYGQIPASGFNFKSILRKSCFFSLADETKFASYQIASIQVWGFFFSRLCVFSR